MSTKKIYEHVKSLIHNLESNKEKYVHDPLKDHTRKRKISFYDCILSCLCMNGGTLFSEMIEYFGGENMPPSRSALIQQRSKIKVEAYQDLFKMTGNMVQDDRLYKGYRLFAVDGSDLHIPGNKNDVATYFPGVNGQRSYNLMHLNVLYDLASCTYKDAIIQDRNKWNEADAAISMVDDSTAEMAILMADRGYESYNFMAHIKEKGWKYLIRIKDIDGNGIASRLRLPEESEFDECIDLNMTRKLSNEVKESLLNNPNEYRYAPPNSKFDYLPKHSSYNDKAVFYHLPFRILRFSIPNGTYETVVTNLDADTFPPSEVKKLYDMRWGVETSFRALKYNTGLLFFHSRKKELILQEIYARLALFNIVSTIAYGIPVERPDCKYEYTLNVAHATHICRKLFLARMSPHSAELLLSKSVVPIRKGRSFKRRTTPKIAINFTYRVA